MTVLSKIIPSGRPNRPGTPSQIQSVTIHETGNANKGANALAHATYLETTSDKVSWHYTVDDTRAVAHLPEDEIAWHSGSTKGNTTSIGIEICINNDGNFSKALENTAVLCAEILSRRKLTAADLRQHFDWNGKNCPQNLRLDGWKEFVQSVDERLNHKENAMDNTPAAWAKDAVEWAVKNALMVGDETGNLMLRSFLTREQFCVILKRYHDMKESL